MRTITFYLILQHVKGSTTHSKRSGGGGGVLKRITVKLQFMMANYTISEFVAIMQHLIAKFEIYC